MKWEHRYLMEPLPLLPKRKKQIICPDNSHIIRAIFQNVLEEEVVSHKTAQNIQKTCNNDLQLKEYADTIHKTYEDHNNAMANIIHLEATMMQNHASYLVKKDKIIHNKALYEKLRLRRHPVFKELNAAAVEKYALIQASDLLPAIHDQVLDFQTQKQKNGLHKYLQHSENNLPDAFNKPHTTPIVLPPLEQGKKTVSQKRQRDNVTNWTITCCDMDRDCGSGWQLPPVNSRGVNSEYIRQDSRKYLTEESLIPDSPISNQEPVTFIAIPKYVKFTNYAPGNIYQKVAHIQNVSNKVGRFEVVPLQHSSKFEVWWDDMPGSIKMIAAGMSLPFHISFICDSLDEAEDEIIVKTEGSRDLYIRLIAHHKAPLLTVNEFVGVLEVRMSRREQVLRNSFECGISLLGKCVSTTIRLTNTGGEGEFWIMSEEDWNFASLCDVSWDNVLNITPFWLTPAYFSLGSNQVMDLTVHFQPETFGMQAACVYIACNNCSVLVLELLGDGTFYKKNFIEFRDLQKSFEVDIEDDDSAAYCLNIGNIFTDRPAQQPFTIGNMSTIQLDYRWEKRKAKIDAITPNVFLDLPEDSLSIFPPAGKMEARGSEHFIAKCCLRNAPFGEYRIILQLIIENIPQLSIINESGAMKVIPIEDSLNKADILVGEVEVWVTHIPMVVTLRPWIFNLVGGKLSCKDWPLTFHMKLVNETAKEIEFCWLNNCLHDSRGVSCSLVVEPPQGHMVWGSTNFALSLVTHEPGIIAERVRCLVNGGDITLDLLLGAQVANPNVQPSTFLMDLGVVKRSTVVTAPLVMFNMSHLGVVWTVQEYVYDFEMGTLRRMAISHLSSDAGYLCHNGSLCKLIYTLNTKNSGIWVSILDLSVFHGPGSGPGPDHHYILVLADIQTPEMSLAAHPHQDAIFAPRSPLHVGILMETTVTLRNHTHVHISYTWGASIGLDISKLQVNMEPQIGSVPPMGYSTVTVFIMPLEDGTVRDFYLPCFVGQMDDPFILSIVCQVVGLHVTFSLPSGNNKTSMSDLRSYSATHVSWGLQRKNTKWMSTDICSTVKSSNSTSHDNYFCLGHHNLMVPKFETLSDEDFSIPINNVDSDMVSESKMNLYQVSHFEVAMEDISTKPDTSTMYSDNETGKDSCDDNDALGIALDRTTRKGYKSLRGSQEQLVDKLSTTCGTLVKGKTVCLNMIPNERFCLHISLSDEILLNKTSINTMDTASVGGDRSKCDDSSESDEEFIPLPTYKLVDNTSEEEIELQEKETNSNLSEVKYTESVINEEEQLPVFDNVLSSGSLCNSSLSDDEFSSQPSLVSYIPPMVSEIILPYSEIRLKDLQCYKAIKTTFMIKNETPIATCFSLSVRNFNGKKAQKNSEIIQEALAEVQGNKKDEWRDHVRGKLGIVVLVEPSAGTLTEHKSVLIDVWVYANTWGIYTERIICKVTGLQPFIIKLIAEVTGYPVSFPMAEETISPYPTLRFGFLESNRKSLSKSVIVRNSSCLQLSVVWHVFMTEPSLSSDTPFGLILDMFSPMSFHQSTVAEKRLERELCHSVSDELETVCAICNFTKGRKVDTVMEINLSPNYGTENHKYFKVEPVESILQPWGETTITVTVNTTPEMGRTALRGMLLGYIRVAPMDAFCPKKHLRLHGHDLHPLRLDLCADVENPLLSLDLVKDDLKFKMHAVHVMGSNTDERTMSRVYVVRNTSHVPLTACVIVSKPFQVTGLDTLEHRHFCSNNDNVMTLMQGECAEIEISCIVTKRYVENSLKILNDGMYGTFPDEMIDELIEKELTIDKSLKIMQDNQLIQSVILELTLAFPILKISYKNIDFGAVYIEDTKWLVLEISNQTATTVWFQLTKLKDSPEFTVQPMCGVLPSASITGHHPIKIKMYFRPKESKTYQDMLRVHTCIPGDIKEIPMVGVGTFNEKFRPSGY